MVDGQPWPFRDAETLWLPAGRHTLVAGGTAPPLLEGCNGARILSLSAASSSAAGTSIELAYESSSRTYCRFASVPKEMEVDGVVVKSTGVHLTLPKGQHLVSMRFEK
jgi:hypothetical protein